MEEKHFINNEDNENLFIEEGEHKIVKESAPRETLEADSQAMKIVKQSLIEAVSKKASDVFIESLEDTLRIRFRIDGILTEAATYPVNVSSKVISCVKVLASLDIAEHRFPQDGRFKMNVSSRMVDFRVSVLSHSVGEKAVLRVLDKSSVSLDMDKLGFDSGSIEILKKNLKKPYGMVLVCGPTGSGKTTTLYSGLTYINSIESNIVTVEDPVEYQLEGINQVAVRDNVGLTFASVLRSILRQDPDIIMVGEIRDFDTADIAVKASLTGHLVLSTLHTTSSTGAIVRFINMGVEPFLVASSCLVAASQALLRKLCSRCKEEADISQPIIEELKRNGISTGDNAKIYKPQGCKLCNNTGFAGRTGIIEAFEIDSDIRELLIHKASEIQLKKAAVSNGMKTLRQKALQKVIEGTTCLEEVYRVTLE